MTSYGAIARYLGTAKSARLVGWAMNASHHHRIPLPSHRVVNRKGQLSGKLHFPTPTAMQERLEAEGIAVVADQVQDFDRHFWDPTEQLSL